MLAGLDLPRPKDESSVRLRAAQITVRTMRAQGHDYLDLRQDGKRIIYLCILCLKPCYSETILFQHLNGNGHKKKLRSVELTMRLQNPWPFNDGMVFFKPSKDEFHNVNSHVRLLEGSDSSSKSSGALVKYNGRVADKSDGSSTADLVDYVSDGVVSKNNVMRSDEHPCLVVPDVLLKGDAGDIGLKYLGLAKIGARFYKDKKSKNSDKVRRIWCEWLGEKTTDDQDISSLSELDYAVVTLKYAMEISMGWEDETQQIEYRCHKKKKRKSFSDPEDTSVTLIGDNDTSLKDSATTRRCNEIFSSQSSLSCNAILPGVNIPSDELALTGSTSNRELRKEIRKRQRVAVRRMCEVCKHKMQPGKDVAALLNLKTGKLACSSRNVTGAFHVFHVSCLLHWILFCEYKTLCNPIESPKWKPIAKKRKTAKMSRTMAMKENSDVLHSVICPACQGSGKHVKEGVLEKNLILPSQMFKYIIQTFDGRREWVKEPEILQNCSIGLHYPPKAEEIVEEMSGTLGLLKFFTVDDPEWSLETCLDI